MAHNSIPSLRLGDVTAELQRASNSWVENVPDVLKVVLL